MNYMFFNKITYHFISKIIVFPIFKFLFRGELDGANNIPDENSFIIVSNHGSLLDPPFLGHALGRKVSFMAKQELFKIPLLSSIIKACGAYPVKRGLVDKNSIILASKKLFNNEIIGIFIDGTRQKDGFVNKPKNGAALIASKTRKLLLPVAIINSHRLVRFKFFLPLFNKVTIRIGKPINYPLSTSKIDLTETTIKLQNEINFLLN